MKTMRILMAASALMVMVGASAQADTGSKKQTVVTQDINQADASPAAFFPFRPIRRGFCFFHPFAPRCR